MPQQHDHRHDHVHSHGSGIDHRSASSSPRRGLTWALMLTGGFMLVELLGGWYAHSLALLADAGHMLTDVIALAIAVVAVHASARLADERRTYGYRRYQVLAAFVNGLLLVAIAVAILVEAALRLRAPEPVASGVMLAIATAGLFVNLGAYFFLHGSEDNLNTRAAMAHVAGDLAGSAAAIVAAIVVMTTGWMRADPLLSAIVAIWLVGSGYRLVRDSGHVLLEGSPEHLDLRELESELAAAVPGVVGVHHVHAWSLTPESPVMTLHAVVREDVSGDHAISQIAAFLKRRHGVDHVTVQVERAGCAGDCE
jgi:cobalt-zinc-cadmium efflux system protein